MSTCRPFFVIVAATGCTTEPSCSLTTRSTSGATGGATSGTGDAAGATLASGGVDGAGPAEFALAFAGAAAAPGAALADGVSAGLGPEGCGSMVVGPVAVAGCGNCSAGRPRLATRGRTWPPLALSGARWTV